MHLDEMKSYKKHTKTAQLLACLSSLLKNLFTSSFDESCAMLCGNADGRHNRTRTSTSTKGKSSFLSLFQFFCLSVIRDQKVMMQREKKQKFYFTTQSSSFSEEVSVPCQQFHQRPLLSLFDSVLLEGTRGELVPMCHKYIC